MVLLLNFYVIFSSFSLVKPPDQPILWTTISEILWMPRGVRGRVDTLSAAHPTDTDWVLQLVQMLGRTDLFPTPRTAEPEVHLAHVQHGHRLGATTGLPQAHLLSTTQLK